MNIFLCKKQVYVILTHTYMNHSVINSKRNMMKPILLFPISLKTNGHYLMVP